MVQIRISKTHLFEANDPLGTPVKITIPEGTICTEMSRNPKKIEGVEFWVSCTLKDGNKYTHIPLYEDDKYYSWEIKEGGRRTRKVKRRTRKVKRRICF
jgi:hypothetical protein